MHSELTRKYLKDCTAPTADVITVPAIDPKTMNVCYTDCHVMGPHDWFGWIADTFQPEFDQLFLTTPLEDFWPNVRRPQWMQREPQARCIVFYTPPSPPASPPIPPHRVANLFESRCRHCDPGTTRKWLGIQSGLYLERCGRSVWCHYACTAFASRQIQVMPQIRLRLGVEQQFLGATFEVLKATVASLRTMTRCTRCLSLDC